MIAQGEHANCKKAFLPVMKRQEGSELVAFIDEQGERTHCHHSHCCPMQSVPYNPEDVVMHLLRIFRYGPRYGPGSP